MIAPSVEPPVERLAIRQPAFLRAGFREFFSQPGRFLASQGWVLLKCEAVVKSSPCGQVIFSF